MTISDRLKRLERRRRERRAATLDDEKTPMQILRTYPKRGIRRFGILYVDERMF